MHQNYDVFIHDRCAKQKAQSAREWFRGLQKMTKQKYLAKKYNLTDTKCQKEYFFGFRGSLYQNKNAHTSQDRDGTHTCTAQLSKTIIGTDTCAFAHTQCTYRLADPGRVAVAVQVPERLADQVGVREGEPVLVADGRREAVQVSEAVRWAEAVWLRVGLAEQGQGSGPGWGMPLFWGATVLCGRPAKEQRPANLRYPGVKLLGKKPSPISRPRRFFSPGNSTSTSFVWGGAVVGFSYTAYCVGPG